MTVLPVSAADLDQLEPWLRRYSFKPYRHYRVYSRNAQTAILRAEIASALDAQPALSFRVEDEGARAAVIARALPWDSSFFGVPMARIDYILAEPASTPLVDEALRATLAACRDAGILHVTARLDVENIDALGRLERLGFQLMDALVTYRIHPERDRLRVREVGTIRDFEPRDAEEVLDITRESFAGYLGRFQRDPHVPAGRAEAFYLEWARQCISGEMADKLLVSVDSTGRVIGYLTFRRREPASTVGNVAIYGGGLGATRRASSGAYGGLIQSAAAWVHERGGVAECQTQNYNMPVIRVYEAAGGSYVRGEYTLHAWLGPNPS